MSTSSPSDLAVAFRSLPRRLDEAADDAPPAAVATARAAVEAATGHAARLLGCAATVEAIAGALASRRAEDWSDADLTAVQADATAAAAAIRTLANLTADD